MSFSVKHCISIEFDLWDHSFLAVARTTKAVLYFSTSSTLYLLAFRNAANIINIKYIEYVRFLNYICSGKQFYFQCTLASVWLCIDFHFNSCVLVSGLDIILVFPLEIQLFCVRGVMLNGHNLWLRRTVTIWLHLEIQKIWKNFYCSYLNLLQDVLWMKLFYSWENGCKWICQGPGAPRGMPCKNRFCWSPLELEITQLDGRELQRGSFESLSSFRYRK